MKIADYLRLDKPLQFEYARQLGVPYAVGRLPDGEIETYAESFEKLKELKETYKNKGVDLKVIEPAPPNQKIKLGLEGRDEEIIRMCTLIENMGKLDIEVMCFNFMAHFGWFRTRYDICERGRAKVTGYIHTDINQNVYTEVGLVTAEQLWDNLEYMLKAIVPVAEKANVKLAIHPDDPPVPSIQHVGRILTSADAIEKAINLVPSKNLGITLCQGCYTAMGEDVLNIIERFKEKTFFVHFRDISARDPYAFHETFQDNGVNDMAECIRRYVSNGFNGYIRVDHVPTMAGEENENPGYETLGRLYAIGYLKGLIEMANKTFEKY
ncbi:mannonate dehydratase [Barnesiella intestinihominis]|jgi:mannonate dehydratase|uniref:mannonate dehydratase n=1 Tax=Barnesiella intestinihominis TaxID=487174 RepID=UPI000D7A2FB7|nr:MAG: mannonate dehydratase [Clostridiales bacterium]